MTQKYRNQNGFFFPCKSLPLHPSQSFHSFPHKSLPLSPSQPQLQTIKMQDFFVKKILQKYCVVNMLLSSSSSSFFSKDFAELFMTNPMVVEASTMVIRCYKILLKKKSSLFIFFKNGFFFHLFFSRHQIFCYPSLIVLFFCLQ